jgi:ABC-2 type transport system permease protein
MSTKHNVNYGEIESSGSGAPTWWLIFVRELHELWMGGKAPVLVLIFSILLAIMTYVLASNSELSLIPPQEMVYETLKAAIAVALFISLIIGADSISGERERATLEGLLLTPTSRRQLVFGKFLAGISPWPVCLAVTIPYMHVISQGNEVFRHAVVWGAITGSILTPAFTAMGMIGSFWSNSNKTSLFIGLGIYVLFLLPTTLPGRAQTGLMGSLLQQVNPIASINHFLSKILVNNRTLGEWWPFLISSMVFAAIVYGLLFLYAAPSLRLEGGKTSKFWSSVARLIGVSVFVVACSMVFSTTSPAMAQEAAHVSPLQISIDMEYATVKAGDFILYKTTVTNTGTTHSPGLCLAMNIVNLNAAGDIVDPEDWSPQRTQYIDALPAGQSATHEWRVNAILDGDYLVYMVVIPEPDGQNATSLPVSSSGIHLTVTPFTKLNPGGVLPYAIGGPVLLILGIIFLYRLRRRRIDEGGATAGS